jgi:hypothetical protein
MKDSHDIEAVLEVELKLGIRVARLLFTLLYFAAGVLLFLEGRLASGGPDWWIFQWVPIEYFGSALAGAFGYATVRSFSHLLRPRPVFRFDAEGIADRSSFFGLGRIPWWQILSISSARGGSLDLQLRDPGELVSHLPFMKRLRARIYAALSGSVARIHVSSLAIEATELRAKIEDRIEDDLLREVREAKRLSAQAKEPDARDEQDSSLGDAAL